MPRDLGLTQPQMNTRSKCLSLRQPVGKPLRLKRLLRPLLSKKTKKKMDLSYLLMKKPNKYRAHIRTENQMMKLASA